jgi:hypothetical protein
MAIRLWWMRLERGAGERAVRASDAVNEGMLPGGRVGHGVSGFLLLRRLVLLVGSIVGTFLRKLQYVIDVVT